MPRVREFTVVVAVMAGGWVWADPVSIMVRGGAAAPREGEPDVRMVAERLTVDLSPKWATVKAVMEFHNEGAAQSVLMGFPQVNWKNAPREINLEDVTFVVGGQQVGVEHLPPTEEGSELIPAYLGVDSWYVARVPFEADEQRRVEVSYRHSHGGSAVGANAGFTWFTYVLSTAGHWKGTVERIDITVTYGDMVGAFHGVGPDGYEVDEANRRIIWRLSDFDGEPGHVVVEWWPRVREVRVRGKTVPVYAYLANGWTPVIDVAALAEELGWTWRATADAATWVLEAGGYWLQVENGKQKALLNGNECDLLYEARPPLGVEAAGLEGGCMIALRDIQRLVALEVDSNWREGYLSVK